MNIGTDNTGDGELQIEELVEQLKTRTLELEYANRELRRLSHYRSLFLARMSHELRTPLTSILGFSEILLEQEELTEVQRRFCQKIQASGIQLHASLNQLVDLTRWEVGQTELFLNEFSLRETLRELCAAVARIAKKGNVSVSYDLAADLTTVVCDQGKLRQGLYGFLAWSIGRSKSGSVVSVYAECGDDCLKISIRDVGDPIDDFAAVFDPPETVAARDEDMNLLGVIIARRLIDVMKGTVILQNQEAGGLRTAIEIPIGAPS